MDRWAHQEFAFAETLAAIEQGERLICLSSPTGAGKTRMACDLIEHYLEHDRRVSLYTNRKLLVEQTSRVLEHQGIAHGIRAAGWDDHRHRPLQVSSIQTEHARVMKSSRWELHDADLVIVDEAHLQKSDMAKAIIRRHNEAGAAVVGLTATPLGLGDVYTHLIVAGVTSELRACGALVRCLHYGPSEPDLRHIGRVKIGEDLTEAQNVAAIMVPGIFGRVLEWWQRLNPEGKPTILFAPGVKESLWFAEQFRDAGIRAAHIDGKEVWLDGEFRKTSRKARDEVLEGSRDGTIPVICNRFVLREGVDAPHLECGILATVFGSLQSYLQSGGRLLRASPSTGKTDAILIDHGGNWHRHGSLNADREWRLDWTDAMVTGAREQGFRSPENPEERPREPACCPQCKLILAGMRCPCGWEARGGKKSRPVMMEDGTLVEMPGEIYKPRKIRDVPDAAALWMRMYYRARSKKWDATFNQAYAMFASENNWAWLPRDLPMMPVDPMDWFRRVSEVPRERLRG